MLVQNVVLGKLDSGTMIMLKIGDADILANVCFIISAMVEIQ